MAKEVDKEVRSGGMYEQVNGKDQDNYDLQSIELSVWNFSDWGRWVYLSLWKPENHLSGQGI